MSKTMKKAATAAVLSAAIALSVPALASAAAGGAASPTISLNGTALPLSGSYVSEGRTYVNVAQLSKLIGIPYTLDAKTGTVSVGGKPIRVEVKNGAPYAQIRELAAVAGASLQWDQAANTVKVTIGKPAAPGGGAAASDQALVVYGDTVQLGSCLIMNRFIPGDAIVFRMKATDPATGKVAEGAKLQVHLSTGEVLDMQLGDHPPEVPGAERFWSAKYAVTDETPKGTLNYYVTAELGDKKGEYKPFNVMPSLLTIVSADQLAPAAETPPAAAPADAPAGGGA